MNSALELFSGSRSFGKEAEKLGYNVLSIDKYVVERHNLNIDISDLTRSMIVGLIGYPRVIWASPVCSAWSKIGWFSHWDVDYYRQYGEFKPKTKFAFESVKMVRDTIKIFSWFPDAVIYMENPEGMLFKHPVINGLHQIYPELRRLTVTYCQYGFNVRKPTHIWTNNKKFIPKPVCGYSNDCHSLSPRGSVGGILGLSNSYERSKIPSLLIKDLLMSV